MKRTSVVSIVVVALAAGLLAGGAASAGASDASIKAVVKSYETTLLNDTGNLKASLVAYQRSGDSSVVRASLGKLVADLGSLRNKVRAQTAVSPRVKAGKTKFVKGIGAIQVAFARLAKAFTISKVKPAAAKVEAKKAQTALNKGNRQLRQAEKLLA